MLDRPAYDPPTHEYAMLCSTDWSNEGLSYRVAISFRMEDEGQDTELHYAPRYKRLRVSRIRALASVQVGATVDSVSVQWT